MIGFAQEPEEYAPNSISLHLGLPDKIAEFQKSLTVVLVMIQSCSSVSLVRASRESVIGGADEGLRAIEEVLAMVLGLDEACPIVMDE